MSNTESKYIKPFMPKRSILLVEDNNEISALVEIHLENLNFQLDKAFDGETGLNKAKNNQYNLIILDLFLPKKDGIEVCKTLRELGILTPVLMLSSRSENFDKIRGFKVGADAYLTKPFNLKKLSHSIESLIGDNNQLKIGKPSKLTCAVLVFKDFTLDTNQQIISIGNRIIPMKPKEYALLSLLACNPGIVYSRKEILQLIWGFDLKEYRYKVTSYISQIRQKIEPNFLNPNYILASQDGGFKFNEKNEAAAKV